MRISELIARLQEEMDAWGDMPVMMRITTATRHEIQFVVPIDETGSATQLSQKKPYLVDIA